MCPTIGFYLLTYLLTKRVYYALSHKLNRSKTVKYNRDRHGACKNRRPPPLI